MSTWNFQSTFLEVEQCHPWHQGCPCLLSFLSGTLNFLQVPLWRTPHSWHTYKKDIMMKSSGYLPWGQTWSFMTSRMTYSSKSALHNHQHPTCTPVLDTLTIMISTQNCQSIFPGVKQGHPWCNGLTCSPSLLSETLNILQVPPWRIPQSWHSSK